MIFPIWLQEIAPYIKQIACFLAFSMWEYWLGKNKKTASSSTIELIGKTLISLATRLFKRKGKTMSEGQEEVKSEVAAEAAPMEAASIEPAAVKMKAADDGQADKVIELGKVGKLELDFDHGKASVKISMSAPGDLGIEGGAMITVQADELVSALVDALAKKLPDSAKPMAEAVKAILVSAIKAIP